MTKKNKLSISKYPAIISAILLLLTFFDWPYGFYTFLRIAVTGSAIYYAYLLYLAEKFKSFWFWVLMAITILFNPIIPVYLHDKDLWGFIDAGIAIFFLLLISNFRAKKYD